MGRDISSLPTFHSLGTRESYLFSKAAKAETFVQALDAIKAMLDDASSSSRPNSVPQLIQMIFNDNVGGEHIEKIREVIRPNHSFGFHDISATGTKLMACLAIATDPTCFDESDHLRVDYVKSLIRGWFANGDTLSIDDSALQNINVQRTNSGDGIPQIVLGKNRLSDVTLKHVGEVCQKLWSNYQAADLGKKSMALNLSSIPTKTVTVEFTEATVGDMNGNSLMFLHELVNLGFASIKSGKEGQWDQLEKKIRGNDISNFNQLLYDTLEFSSTDKKLVLLGDLLSDRTFNDWFTLGIIDLMHMQGQTFEIIFSNHDAGFVEYYLANKDKSLEPYEVSGPDFKHSVNPNTSLVRLNDTLKQDPSLREEFKRLAQNYLSHLNIISCSQNQQQFYSHGIVNQNMVEDMLTIAGVNVADQANLGIQEKVRLINTYFNKHAFASVGNFRDLMSVPQNGGNYHKNCANNPFFFSIWNIGPFSSNHNFYNNPLHRYYNAQLPVGVTKAVHGHTEEMTERMRRGLALESIYKKFELSIKEQPEKDLQSWIKQVLPFLINLESHFANPELLERMFILFLDKVNDMAMADNKVRLTSAIKQFFADCDKFPRFEVAWFEAYESNDPNDIVMLEKRRQEAIGKQKAQYVHVPKKDNIFTSIKSVFKLAQETQMAIMAKSLKALFDELYATAGEPPPAFHEHALVNFSAAATNKEAVIKQIRNINTDGSKRLNKSNLHTEAISDLIDDAIRLVKNDPLKAATDAAIFDMAYHLSLDGSFGAFESDVVGEKAIMLN